MEHFVKIVNGSHPLTTISAKHFNLDLCWDSKHAFVFAGESLVPITLVIHFNPAESGSIEMEHWAKMELSRKQTYLEKQQRYCSVVSNVDLQEVFLHCWKRYLVRDRLFSTNAKVPQKVSFLTP